MFKLSPRLRRILTIAIILIVAGFFLRAFQHSWSQVRDAFHSPNWVWIFISVIGFSIYYGARVAGWRQVLKALGYPHPQKKAARILMLSEITRYVPGNVWSVLGRIGLSTKQGVPTDRAFIATVAEILALLSASLIVGGSFAAFAADVPIWVRLSAIFGGIAALVLAFAFGKLDKAILWLMRRLHREGITWNFPARSFLLTVGIFIIAWVGFTLGSYAVAAAFLKLEAGTTMLLFATFPIAWFLGYASFVTPSGLGVREAAVAVLLAPVYGSVGVVIATYSRIAMTLVELAWVIGSAWQDVWQAVCYVWRWLRSPRGVVIIAISSFTIYFSVITLVMQSKVITSRFDLGNMTQTVWNTSHGRFFEFTNPYGTNIAKRYIHHADILLVLLAPIYWVYANPNVLLVLQALIVGLGGWLVFKLAHKVLGHEWLAAVLALSYLFYPTLQRAVLFDFHALTLGATFALGIAWAYSEKRWRWFTIFAVLLSISKEELPVMVATFGAFMLWRDWKDLSVRKIAFTTIGLSLVYFGLTYFAIMPAARNDQPSKYVVQYDVLGDSPKEMIQTAIHNPKLLLSMVAGAQARHMYAGQMGSVGFLPVASPLWLAVSWPDYVVNLFNERIEPRLMIYHYQATIGGFVFIATIFGIAALRKRIGPWWDKFGRRWTKITFEGVIIIYLVIIGGIESYRLSPLPYSQTKDMRAYWPAPMAPIIKSAVAMVPDEARVSATNTVGAQLAHRQYLYQFPNGIGDADYILILMAKEGTLEWQRNHIQAESLVGDKRYKLMTEYKNFRMYQKL